MGSQLFMTPSQYMSNSESQNPGIEKPIKLNSVIDLSCQPIYFRAAITPSGIAKPMVIINPIKLISKVIGKASCIMPLVILPSASLVCQNTGF